MNGGADGRASGGFRWVGERDIRELAAEAYAIRVLDALQPNAAPAVRHHDGTHLL